MDRYLGNAVRHLNQTVWFGISDYWNASVCLFHKELNGPGPRPSEFKNTRKTPKSARARPTEEALEYMRLKNRREYILYEKALEHFKRRAEMYDCPLE